MIRGFGLGYWSKCLLSLLLEFKLALVLLGVQCHHSPFFSPWWLYAPSKLTGGWERVLGKVESNILVYLTETCKAHQCVVSLGGWTKSMPTILRLQTLVVMSGRLERGGWQPPAHSRIVGTSSGRSPDYSPHIILLLQEGWE
jgi:hypothetical protein